MSKLAIVSGYWAPLHNGHLDLFQEASQLGSLMVIVNNDKQVKIKGSVPFMPLYDRCRLVACIRYVDEVFPSIDTDGTVNESLEHIWAANKDRYEEILFCNGGPEYTDKSFAEKLTCHKLGIKPVYSVGGNEKINSSSWILQDYLKRYNEVKSELAQLRDKLNGLHL
jgi:cytidyltransferase-like protein